MTARACERIDVLRPLAAHHHDEIVPTRNTISARHLSRMCARSWQGVLTAAHCEAVADREIVVYEPNGIADDDDWVLDRA